MNPPRNLLNAAMCFLLQKAEKKTQKNVQGVRQVPPHPKKLALLSLSKTEGCHLEK